MVSHRDPDVDRAPDRGNGALIAAGDQDAQQWLDSGLTLLTDLPEGLEGGIRMQQAALAFDQALRCGLPRETLASALRGWMGARLGQMREVINQI